MEHERERRSFDRRVTRALRGLMTSPPWASAMASGSFRTYVAPPLFVRSFVHREFRARRASNAGSPTMSRLRAVFVGSHDARGVYNRLYLSVICFAEGCVRGVSLR